MDITALSLGFIVVGVSFYLIARPLFRPAEEGFPETEPDEEILERERESVFTTLGELEFDHHMRKLSDEDYQALQTQYKRQAVSVLKAEEESGAAESPLSAAGAEAEVEREIDAEIEGELAAELNRMRQEGKDRAR